MENQMVRKANHLIEASYKLSTLEQKIILYLASTIRSDDDDFKSYLIKIREFQDFIGNSSCHYDRIEEMVLSLKEKNLKIVYPSESGRKVTLNVSWLSSSEYEEGSGVVKLCFDPKLKPFLLQLKCRYTKYRLKNVVQLKSQFSIRIYELLKQYERIGKRLLEVSDLRSILGIEEDQYLQYSDFRKRVIIPAQVELSEKTDISFEFEELKRGRSVGQIRFIITSKSPDIQVTSLDEELLEEPQIDENNDDSDLKKLVALLPVKYRSLGSIQKALSVWLKKSGFDYVARNIEYANAKSNAVNAGAALGKGSNYRNYLALALRGDFGLPFKEDMEAANTDKEAFDKREAALAEARDSEKEQARIGQENMNRARVYQQSLSSESLAKIREEALDSLDAQQRNLILRKTPGAEMLLKIAMTKVCLARMHISSPENLATEA